MLSRKKFFAFGICILAFQFCISSLFSETRARDTDLLGLYGPVKEIIEKQSIFKMIHGDWRKEREHFVQRIIFNTYGNKIQEIRYDSSGNISQEIDYTYDSTEKLREIRDIGNYAETIKRFDESGKKVEEIQYYKYSDQIRNSWKQVIHSYGTTIEYKEYTSDGGLYRSETTVFNKSGKVIQKRNNPARGDPRKWEYEYDIEGKLIRGKFYERLIDRPHVWYSSYDERGNLIEVHHRWDDGRAHSKRVHIYDDENRMKRQIVQWYSESEAVEFTYTYFYDTRGNCIEEVYQHHGISFETKWSYAYNHKDEKTLEAFYNSQGLLFSEKQTEYDVAGKTSEVESVKGISFGYRTINEYNSQNRLLETIRYDLSGEQQYRRTYIYNNQGDLVEDINYNPDDSLNSKSTYEYEYDEKGNWVVKRTFKTDNLKEQYNFPSVFQKRSIIYYE